MPQSTRLSLLAHLPKSLLSTRDDKVTFFVDFWTRMHGETSQLAAALLKYVEWSPDGAAAKRYVWEVCEWPNGSNAAWAFVCWMLDERGMWLLRSPSKEEALHYFEQSPEIVMRPHDVVSDDVAEGARQRRAS